MPQVAALYGNALDVPMLERKKMPAKSLP